MTGLHNMGHGSRVLIIDNYDSFTYNLVHYVQQILNDNVQVVRNDESKFPFFNKPRELFSNFDLIILSPGPGDPEHDCGCVTDFVLDCYFNQSHDGIAPVLFGVCMGYEAIGARLGIPLIRLVPRHGMEWKMVIDHANDTSTLFRNLPEVIEQVRYHSLTLSPAALFKHPDLIVTSSTIDVDPNFAPKILQCVGPSLHPGEPDWLHKLTLSIIDNHQDLPKESLVEIPMSFRHRSLPIYATQFHPESILSEHGFQIIENICRLVNWRSEHFYNTPALVLPEQTGDGHTYPRFPRTIICKAQLDVKSLPSMLPLIFRKFFYRKNSTNIWLDSPPETTGRWSIMVDSNDESKLSVYVQRGDEITCTKTGSKINQTMEEFVSSLEKNLLSDTVLKDSPICAPAIFTFLGYEAASVASSISDDPDSIVVVANRLVTIDNETSEIFATFLEGDDKWGFEILQKISLLGQEVNPDGASLPHQPVELSPAPLFRVLDSRESYMEKIRACQTAIAFGESYELCLTTQIESTTDVYVPDTLELYELVRKRNPAPFSAYVESENFSLLSVSPELLLKVNDGIAQVKPIKGTRPRGSTEQRDDEIRRELATCEKDVAENLMIVDLVRNDLSTVCSRVNCPKLMQVETFPFYHQLVSTVEATLRDTSKLSQLLFRVFPAGSMTGAPKIRSIDILASLESRRRGIGYSGSIGFISPRSGSATHSVVIRTLMLKKSQAQKSFYKISIGCGGAILGVSDPVEEWKEMLTKSRPNLRILGEFLNAEGLRVEFNGQLDPPLFISSSSLISDRQTRSLIETMRYEGGRGVWLFEQHAERLLQSLRWMNIEVEKEFLVGKLKQVVIASAPSGGAPSIPLCDIEGLLEKTCRNTDWVAMEGPVGSWKVRVEMSLTGEWKAEWSCMRSDHPCEVEVCPEVRVDSTQELLRHKINDWVDVVGIGEKISRQKLLLVNELGEVTETGIANIAIRKGGDWVTPPKTSGLLPGTLRAVAIERGVMKVGKIQSSDLNEEILCFNSVRGFWIAKVG